jgi:hypothetical protein
MHGGIGGACLLFRAGVNTVLSQKRFDVRDPVSDLLANFEVRDDSTSLGIAEPAFGLSQQIGNFLPRQQLFHSQILRNV